MPAPAGAGWQPLGNPGYFLGHFPGEVSGTTSGWAFAGPG